MAQDAPHPITPDDLDRLGINDKQELFWDGKRVEVRSRLNLSLWQTLGAVVVGAAAVCGGVASAANDGTEFSCRQWHVLCGHQASLEAKAEPPARKAGP